LEPLFEPPDVSGSLLTCFSSVGTIIQYVPDARGRASSTSTFAQRQNGHQYRSVWRDDDHRYIDTSSSGQPDSFLSRKNRDRKHGDLLYISPLPNHGAQPGVAWESMRGNGFIGSACSISERRNLSLKIALVILRSESVCTM
jgi:hypothetical protein